MEINVINAKSNLGLKVLKLAPPIVVHELLSHWLRLEDICRFDTSASNKLTRRALLFYMDAYKISFDAEFETKRSQDFVEWLAKRQVRVRELSLLDCDAIPLGLMVCSSQITKIHLTDCHFLSNVSFVSLLVSVPLLKVLKISNCHLIGDASFLTLGAHKGDILSKLEHLSISDCARVRDRGLSSFFNKRCRNLKTFSIKGCKVTEKCIAELLLVTSASLTSFLCENCLTVSGFGSIFKTLAESVDSRQVSALEDFTLGHKALVRMDAAVEHVTSWLPSLASWEKSTGSPLRLRVIETEGVEEFAIQVRYLRGSGANKDGKPKKLIAAPAQMGSPVIVAG